MAKHELRIGFGTSEAPYALSLKAWTSKAETYLTVRLGGRLQKMSLHSGDYWAAAFTGPDGRSVQETHRWTPQEIEPGWIGGPMVFVPRVDDRHDLPSKERKLDSVNRWLPMPAIGHATLLGMLFTSNPKAHPLSMREPNIPVGKLPLSDGRTLWLTALVRPLNAEEARAVRHVRDEIVGTGQFRAQGIEPSALGATVTSISTGEYGRPVWELYALGSHNFTFVS